MKTKLKSLKTRIENFLSTDKGKITAKLFKYFIHGIVIIILGYQVWKLGITEIIHQLPIHPLFYVLFLLIYFSLPISEYFTYRRSVPLRFWKSQGIFLRKRIYNKTIVGYSGELQLFFWLKKEYDVPEKRSFQIVRDNNTLSTIASTFVTITLLLGFILSGNITLLESLNINTWYYLSGIGAAGIILFFIFRQFKEYLYNMNRRDTLTILGIHSIRLYILAVLQVLQWYVVMPEVELQIWITIIAMQIILSRLPFIPNKDLIFISASLEYGQSVAISATGLAGLLIVNHILDKILNALLFGWISWRDGINAKNENKPEENLK